MRRVSPRAEGAWAPVLATFTFMAFLIFFALLGIGIWRFVKESRDRSDKLSDIRSLTEDIIDLTAIVLNITTPDNCTLLFNDTQPTEYPDDEFLIFDGADPTSEMQFNNSLITTLTTQLLTVQNVSGTVAYLSDVIGQSSVFQDDTFAVQNVADNTKEVMLDVSGVAASTTRTMTIQDASGTIAYLGDIPTFPTVFLDDAFTVINAADNSKEVMLNCSVIASGATRIMTVQDADGTIAYLSDLGNVTAPPFADDSFGVFAAGTPSSLTILDVSGVSTATTIVMTVQDRDGVIAYLSDILQMVEVFVNTSRIFPDVGNEGVSTLAGLGDLTHIEISLCGGGGGGGEQSDSNAEGAGGSGGGFENFFILTPADKFTSFNATLGVGGDGTSGVGDDGTETTVTGVSVTDFFLELVGYGGGGGLSGSPAGNFAGGAGGGGGGNAATTTPGIAGTLGGLVGGSGAFYTPDADATRGGFKFPWRSGGGGGAATAGTPHGAAAAWQGGPDDPTVGAAGAVGASSMFAQGGQLNTPGGVCAGGGIGPFGISPDSGHGGDGAALFRYYVL